MLKQNEDRFPKKAYELATSDWYYGFDDHRAPHDSWLEWAKFEEPATGDRNEIRHLSLRVRLLGAYHDMYLEFYYPKVYSYSFAVPASQNGHSDWLFDEFRLNEQGRVVHEIEWDGGPWSDQDRWVIEASDVEFSVFPKDA